MYGRSPRGKTLRTADHQLHLAAQRDSTHPAGTRDQIQASIRTGLAMSASARARPSLREDLAHAVEVPHDGDEAPQLSALDPPRTDAAPRDC